MMLQKTKALGQKVLGAIKRNVPAVVSFILTLTAVALTVSCSAHTVNIFDGNKTYSSSGIATSVDEAIGNFPVTDKDYEIIGVSNNLFSTTVNIAYLHPLTIRMGDSETTYTVREGKLSDALTSIGITLDEEDVLSLSPDTYISGALTVDFTDVEYATETTTETIPYENDVIYSDWYDTNTSFVTAGKVGTKSITNRVKYVNGVAVETVTINEKITEYAVDKTTVYGTSAPQYAGSGSTKADDVACISKLDAPDNLLLDANGKPIRYASKKTLRATAYTHTGNRMATGKYPTPGYIAVDPKEIPYGTKMYIVSADGKYVYGYAIAADTGGFIKGTRTDVDLFLDSEAQCKKFGRRDIIVYFLD
jgi:3D (Asp-Asp-Asp) domain-containing protein